LKLQVVTIFLHLLQVQFGIFLHNCKVLC
jgi:hypothetical protein